MSEGDGRIATLSPERRAILEQRLRQTRTTAPVAQTIPRRPAGERIPLSFGQQQVWLLAQLAPDSLVYNETATIRLMGVLDVPVLERSLYELLRRHEAWRTTFVVVDGEPTQIVHPPPAVSLPVTHLEGLPEAEQETEALRLATEDAHVPFDLAHGPLLRWRLVTLSETNHRLFLTLHHIIFDGVSLYNLLLPELAALYEAFAAGRPSPLPELPIQYADYAYWQRHQFDGERLSAHMRYWREQLGGDLPVLQLPTDHPRPAVQTFRGALQRLALSKPLTDALNALSRRRGVTLYMTLIAALVTTLHRYAGQDEIVLGTVTGNRNHTETEKLMGFFLSTLVLRTDLADDPTFSELLVRVRRTVIEAQEHRDLPFEMLVRELHPQRNLAQNPLFQVMFTFEPPLAPLDVPWTLSRLDVDVGTAKVDLTIELDERAEGLIGRFEYNTDLFAADTIARLVKHFTALLEAAVADPDRPLSALPMLSEAERQRMLVEWNATDADYPPTQCVHQLFEAQAARTPDHPAVVFADERYTYREVNERADRLAHHLRTLGVGPGVRVGLCVERSLATVVGLLGVLKAGGGYVPLDPAHPPHRLAFMLADAAVPVLVTQQHLADRLSDHAAHVVCLDADAVAPTGGEATAPVREATPEDLAYVIYTSGSTGTPKGVQVPHRGVVNFLHAMQQCFAPTERDVFLALTSLTFDIAVLELLLPLTVGARTVIVPRDVAADGVQLAALQRASGVTVMQATPATWQLLLNSGWKGDPHLTLLCGGESLPRALAARLRTRGAALWNLYGPTETTVWSTVHRVTATDRPIPIGRPVANTRVYVLDAHLQPVPIGAPGELYIGGSGVTHGYLHRPELTAERFLPDPFGPAGSRFYRTGDLVRWLADGTLEYLGRLDHQVKVRGFRIELGEIEAVLMQQPAVREAVVLAQEDANGDTRLIAYIASHQTRPTLRELRDYLHTRLPDSMMPSAFVFLDAFPLTPNRKVDRAALLALDAGRAEADADAPFIAPDNPLERELVALWEEVIGVRPIGVRDNFFDLGGHSLLAVRLFARLEEQFGKRISVAALFRAPTIAQLAELLTDDGLARFSSVVPIAPEGTRPPFFCVHGFGGNIIVFRELARYLQTDNQPLYGLQARELDGVHDPFTNLQAMAAHYIAEMRTVQPEGPYYLGGYSGGALIALEMAQQLWASGQAVGQLTILDGGAPNYSKITVTPKFAVNFLTNLPPAISAFVKLGSREMGTRLGMHRRVLGKVVRANIATRLRRDIEKPTAELEYLLDVASELPPQVRQFVDARKRALLEYVPRPYPGRITLLRARAQPLFCSHDPLLEWGPLAGGGVDMHIVPGKHHTLLREPYVRGVAKTLSALLAAAQCRHAGKTDP